MTSSVGSGMARKADCKVAGAPLSPRLGQKLVDEPRGQEDERQAGAAGVAHLHTVPRPGPGQELRDAGSWRARAAPATAPARTKAAYGKSGKVEGTLVLSRYAPAEGGRCRETPAAQTAGAAASTATAARPAAAIHLRPAIHWRASTRSCDTAMSWSASQAKSAAFCAGVA